MSVEQAATADTALAGAPAKRGEMRILGPLAVGLALLSAFVTFIVLADFTPLSPTHDVVVSLLAANAATVRAAAGGHRPRRLAGRAGTPDRTGGRTIACPDRRNLLVDRCGTGDPGGDRRQRDARPRP